MSTKWPKKAPCWHIWMDQCPILKLFFHGSMNLCLGELIYFFEMGCALSGYILDVNPFDQPGVEDYKKNMFALLEKPGFEKQTAEIKKRLS
jgi:glucose-6-phosphate isomerase